MAAVPAPVSYSFHHNPALLLGGVEEVVVVDGAAAAPAAEGEAVDANVVVRSEVAVVAAERGDVLVAPEVGETLVEQTLVSLVPVLVLGAGPFVLASTEETSALFLVLLLPLLSSCVELRVRGLVTFDFLPC